MVWALGFTRCSFQVNIDTVAKWANTPKNRPEYDLLQSRIDTAVQRFLDSPDWDWIGFELELDRICGLAPPEPERSLPPGPVEKRIRHRTRHINQETGESYLLESDLPPFESVQAEFGSDEHFIYLRKKLNELETNSDEARLKAIRRVRGRALNETRFGPDVLKQIQKSYDNYNR